MIIIPPPLEYPRRRVHKKDATAAPTASLTLVVATYDFDAPSVDLQFDRAVSIASISAGAITVDDGETLAQKMGGTSGATMVNPTTVRVPLVVIGDSETSQVLLSASNASGIVASNDGGTWAGVTDGIHHLARSVSEAR
jgi:hypothetical protein